MFYKKQNEILFFGDTITNGEYTLISELHDDYEYPVDGWYWFDTEDAAYEFFSIAKPVIEEL